MTYPKYKIVEKVKTTTGGLTGKIAILYERSWWFWTAVGSYDNVSAAHAVMEKLISNKTVTIHHYDDTGTEMADDSPRSAAVYPPNQTNF
jgi:hypothetical protein